MAILGIMRHGPCKELTKGTLTGWNDIPLTECGKREIEITSMLLRRFDWKKIYTSKLVRSIESANIAGDILNISHVPRISHAALNDRNWGIWTNKSAASIEQKLGKHGLSRIKKSFDHPIQGGETRRETYSRVSEYCKKVIFPDLQKVGCILIVNHSCSLRPIMGLVENLSEKQAYDLEFGTSEAVIYEIDENGKMISKAEIRKKKFEVMKIVG
jgi:2,3-bisphosphoglycerate-dependent phosphoglycerate mutase